MRFNLFPGKLFFLTLFLCLGVLPAISQVPGNNIEMAWGSAYQLRDSRKPLRTELIKWNGDEIAKTTVELQGKYVNDCRILADKDGSLLVTGYYSAYGDEKSSDGAFILRYHKTLDAISHPQSKLYEFPFKVMQEYVSAKDRPKMEKAEREKGIEAGGLALREVLVTEQGSVQLFGEVFDITYKTSSSGAFRATTFGAPAETRSVYHYDDVFAMSIHPSGQPDWVVKVPKRQIAYYQPGGCSFSVLPNGNGAYVFFMDNEKNLELHEDEHPSDHSDGLGGMLMSVRIGENGETTKSGMFDVREKEKKIEVKKLRLVAPGQMMGRAFQRRESQPILFQIK
jgi:hypothetical protein